MSSPVPRRFRPPPSTALLTILAAIIGTIAVVATVIAVLLWVRLDRQADRVDRQTDRVADVVAQIQAERERNVLRACLETNARHDRAVERLDRIIDAMPSGPELDRARRNRDSTVALIDALQPHHADCMAEVGRQVAGERP